MRDGLLIRHFLWRFVEHDLVSPDADRRDVLAIVTGTVVTVNLFLAVVIAAQYQFDNFMPPGILSIRSVDDRFLFVSATMLIAALAAVAQWDALALDARDTAVLGLLPIPTSVIVRTKFAATAIFATAVIAACSGPSTLLRLAAIPIGAPVGMLDALWLTLVHCLTTVGAGAFGFGAVLALRETAFALAGPRRFRRVSALLQGTLLVALLTALLLLPGQNKWVAQRWLAADSGVARAIPVFWFVGLHETLAGGVFDNLPRVEPDRWQRAQELRSTALYRSLWPLYRELAPVAVIALVSVAVLATLACLWNSRRLPTAVGQIDRGTGLVTHALRWLAVHGLARRPLQQAGFFFALQTLPRRLTHRMPMAAAFAVGLSFVVIMAGGAPRNGSIPVSLLVAQQLLIISVVTGFRHATRLPAELRATSSFSLAWSGEAAPYISGVKRAGWIAVVLPALTLIGAWHVIVLGPVVAAIHGAVGLGLSAILMEALFLRTARIPLASAHVPDVDAKAHAIVYGVAVLVAAVMITGFERWALETPLRTLGFLAMLFAVAAGLASLTRRSPRWPVMLALDEAPPLPTQRLNLAG